jgi:hypothetical protein
MEKIESYYYTLTLVDSEPVDVKVIQRQVVLKLVGI